MSKNKKRISGPSEFAEIFKQHGGKEFWYMFPFREGKIKEIYLDGNWPKCGITRPLTQEQIDDIERIMQCRFEIESLRAFLSQNCNVNQKEQFDNLTWEDILRHFQRFYLNSKKAVAGVDTDVGKEKLWNKADHDYMPLTKAIFTFVGSGQSTSTFSTQFKKAGTVRYMCNGKRRTSVHIGDFIAFLKDKYPQFTIKPEVLRKYADKTLTGIENKESKIVGYTCVECSEIYKEKPKDGKCSRCHCGSFEPQYMPL